MKNTSLNQILNAVQSVSESHAQINSFGFGTIDDLAASTQVHYPTLWCDCSGASIEGKTLSISLDIYILDVQKDDMINEQDTVSDTLQIIEDVYAALSDPTYRDNWTIPYALQLSICREAYTDKVNGWKGAFIFEMEQTRDRCQIPSK